MLLRKTAASYESEQPRADQHNRRRLGHGGSERDVVEIRLNAVRPEHDSQRLANGWT